MSINELTTKIPLSFKYSLFIFFVVSATSSSSTAVYAQKIAEQQPTSDPVEDYINAINNVEAEHSAYSTELSDLYLGLGKSLYSRQAYADARQAFQRGMQIERVNYGLDSLSQAPYLLSIADTESYMGNWDESQKALENLYSINTKAYGANDVRMLPVLDQMLDWYLNSYDDRSADGGYANLVVSERIAMRMHHILNTDVPLDDPDTPDRYRRLGYLQYFIANHIKQHGEPSQSGVTFAAGTSSARGSLTTSHRHFQRGKMALEKVIESLVQQPDSSEIDQAMVIAELGDWYLVFGQRFSATEAYQLAYDVLEDNEQAEQLREELFSKPRMISFSLNKSAGADANATPSETQLQVSMMVSENGVPQDIAVQDPTENLSSDQLQALHREINNQRFRPRLIAGQAEPAEHIIFYDKPAPQS
jgi:tetratricopeptide (TPR) repeat protein